MNRCVDCFNEGRTVSNHFRASSGRSYVFTWSVTSLTSPGKIASNSSREAAGAEAAISFVLDFLAAGSAVESDR